MLTHSIINDQIGHQQHPSLAVKVRLALKVLVIFGTVTVTDAI